MATFADKVEHWVRMWATGRNINTLSVPRYSTEFRAPTVGERGCADPASVEKAAKMFLNRYPPVPEANNRRILSIHNAILSAAMRDVASPCQTWASITKGILARSPQCRPSAAESSYTKFKTLPEAVKDYILWTIAVGARNIEQRGKTGEWYGSQEAERNVDGREAVSRLVAV